MKEKVREDQYIIFLKKNINNKLYIEKGSTKFTGNDNILVLAK